MESPILGSLEKFQMTFKTSMLSFDGIKLFKVLLVIFAKSLLYHLGDFVALKLMLKAIV